MLRKISLFFFPIIFFVLIYQYQKNKHYSWDLTAYVAEVLKIDSPKDLHWILIRHCMSHCRRKGIII